MEATAQLQEQTGLSVIASGGVSSMKDIRALKDRGIYGAVLGKAIYDGKLDLKEALTLAHDE